MYPKTIPQNLLLRSASVSTRAKAQLKHVAFEAGERLWFADTPVTHALFPVRGVVSLQVPADEGKQADVGLLGREGFAEIALLFGAARTRNLAIALTAGEAIVVQYELFQGLLTDGRFRRAMERYVRMFLVMLNQISVCNRIHVIEKALIGRLLLMQDRAQTDSFPMTQEFVSGVLGVRKATISRAANGLKKQGVIGYDRRGQLTILDRQQLERQACSCYRTIQSEWNDLVAELGGF
jgi:CRP-like cAMP-binding protein